MKPDLSRRSAVGAKADRDQQLDHALTHELRAMSTPAGDHVDPETLAAWADGGLDATVMASVESHVSSCSRCQSIAGVMARSAPVIAATPRLGFRIPAWWIPIAAGAAAVTMWMVVPGQRRIATAPPTPPAAVAESHPPSATADAAPPAKAATGALARDSFTESQAKGQTPAREDRRERSAQLAGAHKPQESATKLDDATAKEDLDAKRLQQPKNTIAAADSAAAPPPAVAERQNGPRLALAPIEIVSPDASRRWRAQPSGIERSEDEGRTWMMVRPGVGDVITGGIAPTGSICWLIGRSGLVLVTADGSTFARVPLPQAIDLASIAAVDASSATVTTVDGRRFHTGDSGRTWRQN